MEIRYHEDLALIEVKGKIKKQSGRLAASPWERRRVNGYWGCRASLTPSREELLQQQQFLGDNRSGYGGGL